MVQVKVYTENGCPACQKLEPELDKLKKKGYNVNKIICTDDNCNNIRYVPTIIVIKDGKYKQFVGAYSAKEIEEKINKI